MTKLSTDPQERDCARCKARSTKAVKAALAALFLCPLAGCTGSNSRVSAPALSPESASRQALAEYDTNGDGFLDGKELERCPALKSCLKELDTDRDGRISAQEIAVHLSHYQKTRIGLISASCHVTLDGRPLSGATVSLLPETFLGPGIKPATAITDSNGRALMQTEGEQATGVHCAFYRVVVSKKDVGGREIIPAKYNTQTSLGQEIGPDFRGSIMLRLKSK
jgi:hypothetical protein